MKGFRDIIDSMIVYGKQKVVISNVLCDNAYLMIDILSEELGEQTVSESLKKTIMDMVREGCKELEMVLEYDGEKIDVGIYKYLDGPRIEQNKNISRLTH